MSLLHCTILLFQVHTSDTANLYNSQYKFWHQQHVHVTRNENDVLEKSYNGWRSLQKRASARFRYLFSKQYYANIIFLGIKLHDTDLSY